MSNPVLDNVRNALSSRAPVPAPGPRPGLLAARQPGSIDSELEQFFGEIKKLSGVAQRLGPDQIAGALQALVAEQNIYKAALWGTPLIRELGLAEMLADLGVQLAPAHADKRELASCELGITEADFILPETGTLVLRSSPDKPRAVSLLPRVHLAIVTPAALRADMHQVFAEAQGNSYMVFITGPSRTADIELTVTLGVHGPKSLYVWMTDGFM